MSEARVHVFPDDEAASRAGADSFVAQAASAIAARGRFDAALSGGETPRAMYRMLAEPGRRDRVDWSRVHLFWGDDRAVAPGHPRSNFAMARAALVAHVPIPAENVHRMRGELDAGAAADAYERELRAHFGDGVPVLDLIHLGVGADGHTASLFPRDQALDERTRVAIATVDPGRGEPRITLTVPVLLAARRVEVLVLEPERADVVHAILGCERPRAELPATALVDARGEVVWMLSRRAGARVSSVASSLREGAPRLARLVVLGGAGDLAQRLLLPGLAELEARGCLPGELAVVGVGRDEQTTGAYREAMASALGEHAAKVPTEAREATLRRLSFAPADASSAEQLRAIVSGHGPVVAYLALPPAVTEDAVRALTEAGLPPGSRVVVEKPIGEDLGSARSLNAALGECFAEDDVFRIDHFLGLRRLRRFVRRRMSDRSFDDLLRREHVSRVEIVWDERLALEGRAGYYDRTGALRDVVQNHLLQVLALVAMDRPASEAPCDTRRAKVKLLATVRCPPPAEARTLVVRGRYGPGAVDGREVPAYVDEQAVDPARGTETFVALTLHIDTARWRGVPFEIRTGKALARERHELCIHLRAGAGEGLAGVSAGALRVPIDDEPAGGEALSAYGEVLRAVLAGEPSTSVGAAEVEACWRIVEPYMRLFAARDVPMREYPAGSGGPDAPAPDGPREAPP